MTTGMVCRAIFSGRIAENFPAAGTDGWVDEMLTLRQQKRGTSQKTIDTARQEVVWHAGAMMHLLERFVIRAEPLTENLIRQTHRILVTGHEAIDGMTWKEFGGVYRGYRVTPGGDDMDYEYDDEDDEIQRAVAAIDKKAAYDRQDIRSKMKNKTDFIDPRAVPTYMKDIIKQYHRRVTPGDLDPIELASWLCNEFTMIHPFVDGNGRMGRLLLNAVLLKYLGVTAPIGREGKAGRKLYLDISSRCGRRYHEEDCMGGPKTSHNELTALVAAMTIVGTHDMVDFYT